jgi:hypothetical protein
MFVKIARSIQVPALVAVVIRSNIYQLSHSGDVLVNNVSTQAARSNDAETSFLTLEEIIERFTEAIPVYEGDEVTFKFG